MHKSVSHHIAVVMVTVADVCVFCSLPPAPMSFKLSKQMQEKWNWLGLKGPDRYENIVTDNYFIVKNIII